MADRIAVQMLCGQNEEPFLRYAMESVGWANYFTVCNTDKDSYWGKINDQIVRDTAKRLGVELRMVYIVPNEDGVFSFADARNRCLDVTDEGDFVFIVDADDVHYPQWEQELKQLLYEERADSVTAHYYHLTLYKDVFHFSAPREIVYKNYPGTQWAKGVHEQLLNAKKWPIVSHYHYVHYGYIKPQTQVFERWKFYSDIEGDYDHYKGQDPNNIISDRISVCKPLPVPHPPHIQDFLESYPTCPEGALKENSEAVPMEKVGLVLLTHNDEENLKRCLETLALTFTYPPFEVLAIDMDSKDGSLALLDSYKTVIEMQIFEVGELIPLAEALNFGFNHFRQRHDIQYLGWIHPDMEFSDPSWLGHLFRELREHPKVGKLCAANTRDNPPTKLIEGHEQCYIIRKDIVNKIGLFDEGYVGIGGYEDWDYNRRIMNHDNYKVMISASSRIFHTGMATRSRRDTTKEQFANAQYYFDKWGTNDAPC